MKRILPVILCVLLMATFCMTAAAAEKTVFSLSASQTTLHKGDAVTFTVSVYAAEPATSYGLMLSYDSSVFELVNGSCTVGGTLVSSFNNGFAFMFQNATAYSGTVGTVTFKVKENAAFGKYTVSGSASVKNGSTPVEASGASGTVVIACNHSFGSWTRADDATHKSVCAACGTEETAGHTWNSGTVTRNPSCKEVGEKTIACTTCNATKTETIAKTGDHCYGGWTKVSEAQHKHSCSVCGKEETVNHSWDSGKVTKTPSCKETGVKTFACTGCNATRTETIAKTGDHSYGTWMKVSEAQHKHSCSVCGKEETVNHSWDSGKVTKAPSCKETGVKTFACTGCNAAKTETVAKQTAHTYDHACDPDCNVCASTRAVSHNYKTAWSKDGSKHWHECTVCRNQKDVASHIPGGEATESRAQTCTVCGYVIKAALGHTHKYAAQWSADENGHWYACSGCGEQGSYTAHDFENACDADCAVCGYTHEIRHAFEEKWERDETNHWQVCTVCGLKEAEAAHVPGGEATTETAQTCMVCGYEIAPALGVPEILTDAVQTPAVDTEVPPTDAETPATDAQAPAADEAAEFPWWIAIAAAAVAAAGVIGIATKKKKF